MISWTCLTRNYLLTHPKIRTLAYSSKHHLRLYLGLVWGGPNTFSDGIWSTIGLDDPILERRHGVHQTGPMRWALDPIASGNWHFQGPVGRWPGRLCHPPSARLVLCPWLVRQGLEGWGMWLVRPTHAKTKWGIHPKNEGSGDIFKWFGSNMIEIRVFGCIWHLVGNMLITYGVLDGFGARTLFSDKPVVDSTFSVGRTWWFHFKILHETERVSSIFKYLSRISTFCPLLLV